MLDIHGKCRREREELNAANASLIRRVAALETELAKVTGERDEAREERDLLAAQRNYVFAICGPNNRPVMSKLIRSAYRNDPRKQEIIEGSYLPPEVLLGAAVDAYTAWQDDPSPVAASGRTSNEDAADVGATCTCPEVWAGTHRTGSRNLSPSCAQHGEGTQWWRDFWAAQAALGSPRERAEKLRAERLAADSRAGQAGEEAGRG